MSDEVLYQSKTKQKREARLLEQQEFLAKKRMGEIQNKWEDAQVKAASAQSVLDYMVEIFTANKSELNETQVKETEEQIQVRQKEIEEFLMTAKDTYAQELKDFNALISSESV